MNRYKTVFSTILLVPALALVSTQARAEFKCDSPQTRLDRVACEKAAEGPTALRHYIQRMRPIDSLQFSDYVNDAQASAWAQNAPNPAPVKKAPVQTATGFPYHTGA